MGDNTEEICGLCGRHCRVEALQCEKGRKYFGTIENNNEEGLETSKEVTMERDHKEYSRGHRGHGFAGLEAGKENELLALIAKAGHFMHHKHGGKRGQDRILRILEENEEVSQKEVQEQLGIQSGSMSEIVIKLESKGLLERVKDDADKRMAKLRLTELGREKLKEINQRSEAGDAQLFQALSEEEQETLKGLLSKLTASWEESYEAARLSKCNHGEWKGGMHGGHKGCGKHHGLHHGHEGHRYGEHHGRHD
ncbi:MAG TPA: MarR family transcriptional regulator [Clostridiales bacterium]|nr:MarR family transcriptional regulator [Clostridiales bacterium]